MKTVKPMRLGLLYKVFELDRRFYFVTTLLVFFPLSSPSTLLPEINLWKMVGEELGKEGVLDMCMPKPRGEVLLSARGYPPGGRPAPACSARVRLGAIDKTLYLVGERRWTRGVASDPAPFTEMPIRYENAFGGEGFAKNPVGKGFAPVRGAQGEVHLLPNIEDPDRLVRSPRDRPDPAGFDALDFMWPQRFSKIGTYDEAWLKDGFPGLAKDTDLGFFNTAPDDQQIEGYFRGDEPFSLENMHPTEPLIESALPGVATRCFIRQKTDAGDELREIATRLDTVRFFPHRERGILIFRGLTEIAEDDASDVLEIIVGCESLASPKPESHYRDVLARRLDKKDGHLLALRDGDLMPPEPASKPKIADDKIGDVGDLLAREDLLQKNQRRRAEKELERLRGELRALGLDPDEHIPAALPPEEPAPDLDELPAYVERAMADVEKLKSEAEDRRKASEAQAREALAAQGLDYDALVEEQKKKAGGPPRFSAKAELERLKDILVMARNGGVALPDVEAKLADPELEQKLLLQEQKMNEAYRRYTQHFPPAARLDPAGSARLRDALLAGRQAGERFDARDFTGVDLSGVDLRGADLSGIFLEAASLAGANLAGANLSDAVLARCDLSGADLTGAKLAGANLGEADLSDAQAAGADCAGAVFARTNLSRASFRGARLKGADLSEALVAGADFQQASAPELIFLRNDLTGINLRGADLTKCNFIEVTVEGVDFTGATLKSALFVTSKGNRANFRGAMLENLRIVVDSCFEGADLRGANLTAANLRGTKLAGADFTGALLKGADLSECDLRGARLHHAEARESRLVKADLSQAALTGANLIYALLQKANLRGADLRGANLFRADLARVEGDRATNLDDAHVNQARVVHQARVVQGSARGQG
ncbi:DUF2169 domain-containing protein [Sorangium sp. So ce185]|uniref:DUF2169 family type VI secretion system accessory protein n=1 Tax=Sorangium sp. So ce185 TaxID=3133287 RepID=UPI003F5FDA57